MSMTAYFPFPQIAYTHSGMYLFCSTQKENKSEIAARGFIVVVNNLLPALLDMTKANIKIEPGFRFKASGRHFCQMQYADEF